MTPITSHDLPNDPCELQVGDHVISPHQGLCEVIEREFISVFGEEHEYLTVKALSDGMVLMVACQLAKTAGLVAVSSQTQQTVSPLSPRALPRRDSDGISLTHPSNMELAHRSRTDNDEYRANRR